MLFKFGMTCCRSISTPLDRNMKLCPVSGQACDVTRFRQIFESLIYLTITRTDLSYPIGLICQYMSQPKHEHLQCAQRILRYVSVTKARALLYRICIAEQLVGYTLLIGPETSAITDQPLGLRSLLGAPRLCGAARSSRQLHYRAQTLRSEEQLSQHAKPYG